MKKLKKQNYLYIFPFIFLLFPFIFFLVISLIKFFNTGIFNYGSNFNYFYFTCKNIKEYLFPALFYFTFCLLFALINKLIKKRINIISWIILIVIGIIIILIGNRFLFLITNNIWANDSFNFLLNGITPYSFILSSELTFIICSIIQYFDIKILCK